MHDPLCVAFEIRRPWPKRQGRPPAQTPEWSFRGAFWTIGGRVRLYWPVFITVWHREPGGRDSGEVCPYRTHWRHLHHWKIQVHPLQHLRRWALTRCAWCGGRPAKADPVNVSHSWDGPRGRWWRGEPGLFHHGCSSVATAHRMCLCPDPGLDHGDYGLCAFCGKFRAWNKEPDDADRILAALPAGSRLTDAAKAAVEPIWAERQ